MGDPEIADRIFRHRMAVPSLVRGVFSALGLISWINVRHKRNEVDA